jgi:hypothetical protein
MENAMPPLMRLTVTVLAMLTLTACATTNTQSYVPRATDLGLYRTYSWAPATQQATGDPRLDNNEFFGRRIEAAVDWQLAARGLKRAAAAPDVVVHYYASIKQEVNANGLDRPNVECEDCRPFVFDAGTIVIDLIDARTSRLIWRGWDEGTIDGAIDDQTSMERRVDESVARILGQLPRWIGRES